MRQAGDSRLLWYQEGAFYLVAAVDDRTIAFLRARFRTALRLYQSSDPCGTVE